MPYQVLPVISAVADPGSPLVWNPHILVNWANIVVDKLYKEDSTKHIFYWSEFKLEAYIFLLAEDGLD